MGTCSQLKVSVSALSGSVPQPRSSNGVRRGTAHLPRTMAAELKEQTELSISCGFPVRCVPDLTKKTPENNITDVVFLSRILWEHFPIKLFTSAKIRAVCEARNTMTYESRDIQMERNSGKSPQAHKHSDLQPTG